MKHNYPSLLCLLLAFFTGILTLQSQNGWQKTLPNDKNQVAADIIQASDGNYWVLTNILGANADKQIRLLKINPEGVLLDSLLIPRSSGNQLCPLPDGGMVISGQRTYDPNWSGMRALVIKLDAQGTIEWQKEVDQGYFGYANTATPDGLGGYYIGGLFDQTGSIDRAFLSHFSATGAVIWNTTHLFLGSATVQKIVLEGNTLLAFGGASTIGQGPDGFFLMRANASNGAQLSNSIQDVGRFQTAGFYYNIFPPMGLTRTPEGKIWVSRPGIQGNGSGSGAFLYETNGQPLKQLKVSTLTDYYRFPTDLTLDGEGNMIMIGTAGISALKLHPYIEKRTSNGTLIWTHALPISGQLYAFAPTPDGGYIACGTNFGSMQWPTGSYSRALIIRFDRYGNIYPCQVKGRVLSDQNANCQADSLDIGLPLAHLILDDSISLSTNQQGNFEAWIPPGTHQIRVLDGAPLYAACQGTMDFSLDLTTPQINLSFFLAKGPDCSKLEVGLTQSAVNACDTSTLYLSWQNKGNAAAENAAVQLKIGPEFILVDAGAPYSTLPDGRLEFPIGTVAAGMKNTIRLRLKLACTAATFSAACVEAHIEPRSYCWTDAPNWNSAVLQVTGKCLGYKIQFRHR